MFHLICITIQLQFFNMLIIADYTKRTILSPLTSGPFESSYLPLPSPGKRGGMWESAGASPGCAGPTPRQGTAAPWNPASFDFRKALPLSSGRFSRFWLHQAKYTSIILKREQFSVTPPVDGCIQLFLRLVFIKVRFHQTQEVFFR
jgi:hypothetical protein